MALQNAELNQAIVHFDVKDVSDAAICHEADEPDKHATRNVLIECGSRAKHSAP